MRFFILGAILCLLVIQSVPVSAYIQSIQEQSSQTVFRFFDADDALLSQIKKEAKKREIPPIDARVDAIWKAIPGYNGKVVDIQRTYLASRKRPDGQIHWVYREVPPKVQLRDLGAYPIYRGNEHKNMAALMVNVAWGERYLPALLQVLKREKVKATFFLDGSWVKKYPNEAKKLKQEGHEIGNHGYSHPLMSQISQERMREEILKTESMLQQCCQVKSRWFAPPAGDYNQKVVETAFSFQMNTVLWTVDTIDWRKSSTPDMMVKRVRDQVTRGSLILMHPTDRTVVALPEIIRVIRDKGLKLGTVSEVLSSKRTDDDGLKRKKEE